MAALLAPLSVHLVNSPSPQPLWLAPPQAYYEARFGREAWEVLDKIPKELWMQYLVWYREVLHIPVQNSTKVLAIEPLDRASAAAGFRLSVERESVQEVIYARKVGAGGGHYASIPRRLDPSAGLMVSERNSRGMAVAVQGSRAGARAQLPEPEQERVASAGGCITTRIQPNQCGRYPRALPPQSPCVHSPPPSPPPSGGAGHRDPGWWRVARARLYQAAGPAPPVRPHLPGHRL